MTETYFDVFLAHNSLDKPLIRIIAEELKQFGITYWLDEEEILPGQFFQDLIQQAIPKVGSVAICIGQTGIGRWQEWELKSFISQCVDRGLPVIPVLLPGVQAIPDSKPFLKELMWVRFNDGIEDETALANLAKGIKQKEIIKSGHSFKSSQSTLALNKNANSNELQLEVEYLCKSKESKELVVRQLSEAIANADTYINTLREQRNFAENKLQNIKERISYIEEILSEKKDQELLYALDWLRSNREDLSRDAGNQIKRKNPALKNA